MTPRSNYPMPDNVVHVSAYLNPELAQLAYEAGNGNISEGIREALRALENLHRKEFILRWEKKNMNRFPELYAREERDQ